MAMFVRERGKFSRLYKRACRYVNIGAELPDVILDSKYKIIRMAEFEIVLCGDFLLWLFAFCKKNGVCRVWLMMLEPHPETFYYARYGKFGLIEFNCNETLDEIVDIIDEYPVEGIADAIITIAERFLVFSEDDGWCIWGDRKPEAVVLGFADSQKLQQFKSVMPADKISMLMAPTEAFESFMSYPVSRVFSNEQRLKFIENYNMRNK